jgi:arsenate reductase-like glutaredoxin family protein
MLCFQKKVNNFEREIFQEKINYNFENYKNNLLKKALIKDLANKLQANVALKIP